MPLIFDAHLDLAWNVASFDRDLTLPLAELRRLEQGMTDEPGRGRATTSLPELRRAGVAVCVATLLARSGPQQPPRATFKRTDLDFRPRAGAFAAAQGQLACYRLLEEQGHLRLIRTTAELARHWQAYRQAEQAIGSSAAAPANNVPLGVILSMEGADPIVRPAQLEAWWSQGLRAVGPAHYGHSHYAAGTGVSGPLTTNGVDLLREMDRLHMILDVTHLADESLFQAVDRFSGPILASHHNCRALVPGDRQLTDEQIRLLVGRDAVIGVALDAWMLYPGWIRGETSPAVVGLAAAADQIDHVCQLAGNALHSAIGSDLDGGFGTEQTPRDLDTIADLQKLGDIFAERGYTPEDIDRIFHGNWLRFFGRALPA